MSYLTGPRLHFAGTFTADVSTVNNLVTHFKDPNNPPRPGWNPSGTGSWKIEHCTVTSAVFADGSVARTAADDPVVGTALTQPAPARLVDLDPEQQLVSQIWGLRLRLVSAAGPAIAGGFKVAPFSNIWPGRFPTTEAGPPDRKMSAFYQSLLTDIVWGDLFGSRLLAELKQASAPGLLSIKFNVDGFDQAAHVGRIVGTIGPASANEPAHFVLGRHCMGSFAGPVWYFSAAVDEQRRKLIADFGNSLQTPTFRGPFDDTLDLSVGCLDGSQFTSFGRVPIGPGLWYEQTAGICEFPADRPLSDAEMTQLGAQPIVVVQSTDQGLSVVASEGNDGLHVRADDFVYRMSAGGGEQVRLWATKFGKPLPNASIAIAFDPSGLQQGRADPKVDNPESALGFPTPVMADGQGVASLPLSAGSIGTPRGYIDGQVYGLRCSLPQSDPNNGGYFNRADFISVLVWSDFPVPDQPDWHTHVGPILTQYRNLYSVMMQFLDLGDYASVVAHKDGIRDVFSRPDTDPRYMPVTRDLSPAKRNMIVRWFDTTGNAGQPNLGAAPVVVAQAPAVVSAAAAFAEQPDGKSAALQRRLGAAAPHAGFQKWTL